MDHRGFGETADPMIHSRCTEKLSSSQLPPPTPFPWGRLEFVCKRSESPWRILNLMWGFHEHLLLSIFMKSLPSLLNYVCIYASICHMATPLHHHLTLNEATLRTGSQLFWVTTPLRHTPVCVWGERGGDYLTL